MGEAFITRRGGNGSAYYLDIYVTASAGTPDLSGIAVTATVDGSSYGGTTDSDGRCQIQVSKNKTYTVTCSKTFFVFSPTSLSATSTNVVTDVTFTCYKSPTFVGTAANTQVSGRTITLTPTSGDMISLTTGSTGATAETALALGMSYTLTCDYPDGYGVSPSSASISSASAGTEYTQTFTILNKPTVAVTVVDSSSSGYQVGRTITATNGTDTVTGTTNASGVVNLTLNGTGAYTISTNLPSGATADTVSITAAAGGSYTATLTLDFRFKFSMTLNATTMQTDPTGCLTYGDDCAGFTPLVNTNTTFASVPTGNRGSWIESTNPLLKKLYYATFNTDGTISKILDPDNLALDEDGNASDITTKNTMLVIPTLYTKGESGKLTLSDKSAEGTAHAHTIGGHEYDNLAIGVYNGYVSGGKLMSLSGVLPTKSQTRATFRTQAAANGTNWMLMNYWHWMLLKEMTFFVTKSFDGQRRIARGGNAYGSNTTGQTNAMGMFAGDVSGKTSPMKCFIEDWWGSQRWLLDDFDSADGTAWFAGKNASPADGTANKTQVWAQTPGATTWWGNSIYQTDNAWGIANASGGSNATGLCDMQYADSNGRLGCAGGASSTVSSGAAGPSYLVADYGLSSSTTGLGARLAFVFD